MDVAVVAVMALVIFVASFVSWSLGYSKGRKTTFAAVTRSNEVLRSRMIEVQAQLHHANRTVEELEHELYHDGVWNNERYVPDERRQ